MTLYLLGEIEKILHLKDDATKFKYLKNNGQNCWHDLAIQCFQYSFQVLRLKKV